MLLYGRIPAKEWARAFPSGQRRHVMHRWVSAEGCSLGQWAAVAGDFARPEPVSVGLCWGLLVPLHIYSICEISK